MAVETNSIRLVALFPGSESVSGKGNSHWDNTVDFGKDELTSTGYQFFEQAHQS